MLETIVGNRTAARVLLFLNKNGKGFGTEIAKYLKIPLNMVQKQLERFEKGGLLTIEYSHRMKFYRFNKDHPLYPELKKLLSKEEKNILRLVEEQYRNPADGTYLSPKERLLLAERLRQEAEILNPYPRYKPFSKSFDSWKDYESWRKKQTNPWLV